MLRANDRYIKYYIHDACARKAIESKWQRVLYSFCLHHSWWSFVSSLFVSFHIKCNVFIMMMMMGMITIIIIILIWHMYWTIFHISNKYLKYNNVNRNIEHHLLFCKDIFFLERARGLNIRWLSSWWLTNRKQDSPIGNVNDDDNGHREVHCYSATRVGHRCKNISYYLLPCLYDIYLTMEWHNVRNHGRDFHRHRSAMSHEMLWDSHWWHESNI